MDGLYTNSTNRDSLRHAFYENAKKESRLYLASPFFTYDSLISELLERDCNIKLIVRLCSATNPDALKNIFNKQGILIRYFTSRFFHSKLYIFDEDLAIVGSANLTKAGMSSNREVSVAINGDDHRFDGLVSTFASYWDEAEVLTSERLEDFKYIWNKYREKSNSDKCDDEIVEEFGESKPSEGAQVGEKKPTKDKIYLESYKRVYQDFLRYYKIIEEEYISLGKRKLGETKIPLRIEIDQFFSFLRETYTSKESYLEEPIRTDNEIKEITRIRLNEWFKTRWDYLEDTIPVNYKSINKVFGKQEGIENAGIDDIYEALNSSHAFHDRFRFYKGGATIKRDNFMMNNDLSQLKKVFSFLLYGEGDFVDRMGICIFDSSYSAAQIGRSCIQELYGWVNNENIPICNGRTVKALRYLGCDVKIF